MRLFLFLGAVLGAAGAGSVARWQHRRRRQQLAQVAQALENIHSAAFGPVPAGAAPTAEVAHLTRSINQLLSRLQTAADGQRNFVAHSAHKLRTPLAIITGQIEVLLLRPRTAAEHEDAWRSVLQEIHGLNRLANDLQLLNQLSADHYRLVPQPVDVAEVLFLASQKLRAQRPHYQVGVQFSPEVEALSGPLTVAGDAELLEHACQQLLENGCKFSPTGQVRVLLSQAGSFASLRFEDQGNGIPAAEVANIFEPFFRGENARTLPGHGLGLAVARRVAELHHGHVRVLAGPQPGTTIALELPLLP